MRLFKRRGRLCRVLADGSRIELRPLEPQDEDHVRAVFDGLGPASRQHRFLVPKHRLSTSDLRQLTSVDHAHHEAFVALSVADGRPVGIGRFVREREDRDTAEIAITVVDEWQDRGVGSILIETLVERAGEMEIQRFSIMVSRDNYGALRLMDRIPGDRGRVSISYDTAEFVVALPTAC